MIVCSCHGLFEHLVILPLTNDVLGELDEVRLAMNMEMNREEIYWEQRARANWVKFDDKNSSFF